MKSPQGDMPKGSSKGACPTLAYARVGTGLSAPIFLCFASLRSTKKVFPLQSLARLSGAVRTNPVLPSPLDESAFGVDGKRPRVTGTRED
jgi:hypothetical protein